MQHTLISRLRELRTVASALYNRLDDWIIFGIKRENEVTYEAVKQLRSAIANK